MIITGYRNDVADYVNALQILVHASILPEPFGRVLLEGMALRKPLVASDGGAVPEIVVDGVTGLLFRPGDPSIWHSAWIVCFQIQGPQPQWERPVTSGSWINSALIATCRPLRGFTMKYLCDFTCWSQSLPAPSAGLPPTFPD